MRIILLLCLWNGNIVSYCKLLYIFRHNLFYLDFADRNIMINLICHKTVSYMVSSTYCYQCTHRGGILNLFWAFKLPQITLLFSFETMQEQLPYILMDTRWSWPFSMGMVDLPILTKIIKGFNTHTF